MTKKFNKLVEKYGVTERSAKTTFDMDPTENKKFVEWIFKVRYVNVRQNGREVGAVNIDFPSTLKDKVKNYLTWFESNKNGRVPKDKRDINGFKNITEFINFIDELKEVKSRSEIKNEVDIIADDDLFKIVSPKTFESSKIYGKNTKWCTTQKKHYTEYTKDGILYYLILKPVNRKFGCHISFYDNDYDVEFFVNGRFNSDFIELEFYNNEDFELGCYEIENVIGTDNFKPYVDKILEHFSKEVVLFRKESALKDFKTDLYNLLESSDLVLITEDEVREVFEESLKKRGDNPVTHVDDDCPNKSTNKHLDEFLHYMSEINLDYYNQ